MPPPFTAGAEIENFAGSGSLGGFDGAEATLRLGRVIELGGKRRARIALGDAEVAHHQNLVDIARLEASARTRQRFIEVLADQGRLQVAREHVRLTLRARDEVGRAVQSARNPETDLHPVMISFIRKVRDAGADLEEAIRHGALTRRGIVSSTLLTLFVLPALYRWAAPRRAAIT